jgi:tripartite-type tricarboxylate transporter receptor subunit TctC
MQFPRRQFLHLAAGAAALPALSGIARAQAYPTRPVRVIVPFGPGGPTDVFARLIAQKLSQQLGQQFYVENIVGGGSNVGTGQAARAAPDGHTILFTVSAFVTNPAFVVKVPYDPVKDFAPVALPVASAQVLVVHPSGQAKTVKDLVALIKANPGKFTYASGGVGTQGHLTFEQFRQSLGLDIVHVPFGGGGPMIAAVVAGHTQVGLSLLPPALPQIKEGSLRALALTSTMRSQSLANIPTGAEAGYPILEGDQWLGVFVPASTPKEIIATLHRRIVETVAVSDVKERLEVLGFYPVESTPEGFADRIKVELEKWRTLIRTANIKRD